MLRSHQSDDVLINQKDAVVNHLQMFSQRRFFDARQGLLPNLTMFPVPHRKRESRLWSMTWLLCGILIPSRDMNPSQVERILKNAAHKCAGHAENLAVQTFILPFAARTRRLCVATKLWSSSAPSLLAPTKQPLIPVSHSASTSTIPKKHRKCYLDKTPSNLERSSCCRILHHSQICSRC